MHTVYGSADTDVSVGYYGRGLNCSTCPQGAFCPGGDRVWSLPGYYAEDDLPPVVACHPAEACLGGRGSPCAVGYQGIGCSSCTDGYYRDNAVYCYECGSQGRIAGLFFVQVWLMHTSLTSVTAMLLV